ncbi:MAG: protein-L-isoaspartate(D-aspartate) O-methyltransferase [Bacteroidetes bacterium]|nr:protein-L-isoaspartate(D-aspartate) O-methyltransferase [Bacteroidota bacterium]MBL0064135.1 protein-L-isoaspartate(D-aspartate) O-methyltransferase [Bacteroidota bacterium]MBL0139480.1 protein-L-isoaspartate(D-aspartate) O-methyltransferase [Bacteroidota bacterium]
MKYEDNFKHQGMRKQLIDSIKSKGIDDERVLEAMMKVPRHYFLEKAFLNQAYTDQAFKIGAGQTISQPFTVAYQTSLLHLQKGDKVLEIGTGSGYQTCILLEMGAKVFSIERQKELFDKAKEFLPAIGYSPKLFYGDGYKGLPAYAPFDKILVTCGAPFVPEELVKQLKVGGMMVIPVGAGEVQVMTTILKTSETAIEKHELKNFRFVPMLEHKDWGK